MKAPLTLIYFVVRIILIYRISFEYIYFVFCKPTTCCSSALVTVTSTFKQSSNIGFVSARYKCVRFNDKLLCWR